MLHTVLAASDTAKALLATPTKEAVPASPVQPSKGGN